MYIAISPKSCLVRNWHVLREFKDTLPISLPISGDDRTYKKTSHKVNVTLSVAMCYMQDLESSGQGHRWKLFINYVGSGVKISACPLNNCDMHKWILSPKVSVTKICDVSSRVQKDKRVDTSIIRVHFSQWNVQRSARGVTWFSIARYKEIPLESTDRYTKTCQVRFRKFNQT